MVLSRNTICPLTTASSEAQGTARDLLFREHCGEVQASTPCAAVYVGGYDEPEEVPLHEQPY